MIESGKNYSAQQINTWDRSELGQFKNLAGGESGFVIKGKRFKYTASLKPNGETTITVKAPFLSTKGMKAKANTKANLLANALNNKKQEFEQQDQRLQQSNTVKTKGITDKFKNLLQQNGIRDPEVAIYGKGNRSEMKGVLKNAGLTPVTIDEYNKSVGVVWNTATLENVPKFLDALRKKELSANPPKTDEPVSETRRTEWAKYLENNVDRLDVMAKCKKLANKNDQGASLAQFLVKNCQPDKMQGGLANKLKSAGTREAKLDLIKDTDLFKELFKAAKDSNYTIKTNPAPMGMDFTFQNAFFRTTSKMGVEFFASQSVPVAFWTAELGYENELGAVNNESLKLKPWKSLDNRVDKTNLSRNEAITYSEMRYVEKLKNNLSNQQNKERSTGMARFSPSSVQVFPILIKENTGGKYLEMHSDKAPFSVETPIDPNKRYLVEEEPAKPQQGVLIDGHKRTPEFFDDLEELLDPNDPEVQQLISEGRLDPSKLN